MIDLFADADLIAGLSGTGGTLGLLAACYLIWERLSKRRTEQRKEELANEEQQIKIDAMARDSIASAYDELMRVRKAAHEADIANLKAEIAGAKLRLAELESREAACQRVCAALKAQNTDQAAEIVELRARIEDLEAKLRAAGALPPGAGPHTPLTDN